VDLEDPAATLDAGFGHLDEAVEPAGPEDRLVEHIEPVGCGHDPDVAAVVEAVHLREQLHHGPLDLRVAGGLRVRPLGGDGVDLVDEDDRGFALGREFEEVPDESGALADELPDQLGARHLDERGVGLVCDRLRQHRLPGSGRAVQQHPRRRVDADLREHLGVGERLLDRLPNLPDLVVDPADVGVRHRRRRVDLHGLRPGVGLVVEQLLDREGVVDRDPVAGVELVVEMRRDLGQHLLVVAVLFDHHAVVGQLLDRREIQRGGFQRLVAPFQLLQFPLELAPAVRGFREAFVELGVDGDEPLVVLADRRQAFGVGHLRIEV